MRSKVAPRAPLLAWTEQTRCALLPEEDKEYRAKAEAERKAAEEAKATADALAAAAAAAAADANKTGEVAPAPATAGAAGPTSEVPATNAAATAAPEPVLPAPAPAPVPKPEEPGLLIRLAAYLCHADFGRTDGRTDGKVVIAAARPLTTFPPSSVASTHAGGRRAVQPHLLLVSHLPPPAPRLPALTDPYPHGHRGHRGIRPQMPTGGRSRPLRRHSPA